jgi:hypothetical protein
VARSGNSDSFQIYRREISGFTRINPADWGINSVDSPLNALIVEDLNMDGRLDVMTVPASAVDKPRFFVGKSVGFFEMADSGIHNMQASMGLAHNWSGIEPSIFFAKAADDSSGFLSEFFYGLEKGPGEDSDGFLKISVDRSAPGLVNRAGIGTDIMVSYNGVVQWHRVDGGSGRGTQHSKTLVVGLGPIVDGATAVVQAFWPDESVGMPLYGVTPNEEILLSSSGSDLGLSNVHGYFQPGATDSWIVLEWDANYPTHAEADFFEYDCASNPVGCDVVVPGGGATISSDLDEVELEISQEEASRYHHVMRWKNRQCCQNCKYGYTLRAKLNNLQAEYSMTGEDDTTKWCTGAEIQTGSVCIQQ